MMVKKKTEFSEMPKSCGYMLSRIPSLLPQSRPGLFTQKLWEVFGLLWIAVAADSLCCLSCTPTPTFQGTLCPMWWATWGKGLSRGVSCIKLHCYSIFFFFSAPWRREWPPTPVFWPGEFFPEPSEKKVADIMPLMSWSFNVFLCISCKYMLLHNITIKIRKLTLIQHYHLIQRFHSNFICCDTENNLMIIKGKKWRGGIN